MSSQGPELFVASALALVVSACGPAVPGPESPPPGSGHTAKKIRAAKKVETCGEVPSGIRMGDGAVDTLHGLTVRDPYRWLEDEKSADPWITRENERTACYMAANPRAGLKERLDELFEIGSVRGARLAGDRVFFSRNDGRSEQPVLYVRSEGKERPLIDLNAMDPSGRTALDWYYPSPSGKLIAYGLSKNGTEKSTLYVRDVDTGLDRGEAIPNTRAASVAWLKDETGFYYTRYPPPPDDDYSRRIFLHLIGKDHEKDVLIWGRDRVKTDWNVVSIGEDGKWLVLTSFRGFAASDVYLMEIGKKKLVTVTAGEKALFWGDVAAGVLYLQHNLDAPKFTIVAVNPKRPGRKHWKTIVPEGEWPIEGFALIGGKLVVHRMVKATSRLSLHDLTGKKLRDIELPGLGAASVPAGEWRGERMVVGYSSFFMPPGLYEMPLPEATGDAALSLLVGVKSTFSGEDYEVVQVDYSSFDGTEVPMFIVRRKGIELNGEHPTLLYGYGGFNITMRPGFSKQILYWLERGGVYALANLRGGGELGERWHEDGKRERKFKVFYDFEYAMRYLIREGYTSPEKLGIMGGSNGGLLVGAMMTRCPELFGAAVGSVGLYDMVRFHKFLLAEYWVEEYGSPDKAEDFGYLHAYSPYHNVIDGVAFPSLYADTAASDTRVHWNHTAKFIARLHDANSSANPILFFMRRKVGHGRGKSRTDSIADTAQKLTFLLNELGVPVR